MVKHTPTPWKYETQDNLISYWDEYYKDDVVVVAMPSRHETTKANAAFIVKAVNSHDELVELLHVILMQSRTDGAYSSQGNAALSKAMEMRVAAALAKAK